jgi:membrane-associated phospholipid phosphatase
MIVIGLLYLVFIRIRYGLMIFSSFVLSSILVQLLKRIVFPGHIRPVLYFREIGVEIYILQGLDYHYYFSFPSGHSATAFALFIGLAILSRSIILKFSFLFLCCVIAYSRVYLSQHFLEDVLAGSLLGTIVVLFSAFRFLKWDKTWLEKSLLTTIRKKYAQA